MRAKSKALSEVSFWRQRCQFCDCRAFVFRVMCACLQAPLPSKLTNFLQSVVPLGQVCCCKVIMTDVSSLGCGVICEGRLMLPLACYTLLWVSFNESHTCQAGSFARRVANPQIVKQFWKLFGRAKVDLSCWVKCCIVSFDSPCCHCYPWASDLHLQFDYKMFWLRVCLLFAFCDGI